MFFVVRAHPLPPVILSAAQDLFRVNRGIGDRSFAALRMTVEEGGGDTAVDAQRHRGRSLRAGATPGRIHESPARYRHFAPNPVGAHPRVRPPSPRRAAAKRRAATLGRPYADWAENAP